MNPQEMWQAVLAQLQFHTSPANFATWFKNTFILKKEGNTVVVSTPNTFSKEWIENKYHKLISKILKNLDDEIKEVKYVVNREVQNKNNSKLTVENKISVQPRLTELSVNRGTGLNSKYSFDNFVVGPFNELAHAAALAVSKNPGQHYNPLFIYGGVGLGKTHLIQAVGNFIVKNMNSLKVKYTSSDKLVSGVVMGIKNNTIEKFRETYVNQDVLIIDDIQFIAGKEKCQEEFFHLFNNLYAQNKQVIISSDRPPKAIPFLEDRLRSRFEGGMIADIGYPDFESRVAILKAKAEEKGIELSDEVIEFIAENFQRSIRELEGALNRLVAFAQINHRSPDLDITKSLLKNIISSAHKKVNDKKIIQIVAEFYDLKEEELLQPTRKKEIVQARQIAMYIMREILKLSYPFIGRKFKGKDHTTIMHACQKIAKALKEDEKLAEDFQEIKNRIYS